MLLCEWNELPKELQLNEVRPYFEILKKKQVSLIIKRIIDVVLSFAMLVTLSPFLFVVAIIIKIDSEGPVFYRQERVTQYGRIFRIHKFRSMVNEEKNTDLLTLSNDKRVTRVGKIIRKYKIDELPQLIDVLKGDMSFVGTRPEVKKYVNYYSNEMKATLLLPAGMTSSASIIYRNEDGYLTSHNNKDQIYINDLLPKKMVLNLKDLIDESVFNSFSIILKTAIEIIFHD